MAHLSGSAPQLSPITGGRPFAPLTSRTAMISGGLSWSEGLLSGGQRAGAQHTRGWLVRGVLAVPAG